VRNRKRTSLRTRAPRGISSLPQRLNQLTLLTVLSLTVPALGQTPATAPTRPAAPTAPREQVTDLETYLAGLTPQQRQELAAKQQQFAQLDEEEKTRLRQLHAQVQASPDAKKLQSVLHQYSLWLASLSPNERYAVLDTDIPERVERIRQLRLREEDTRLTAVGLTSKDAQIVLEWFQQQATQHEPTLLKTMNDEERKWRERAPNPEARRASLLFHRADELFQLISSDAYDRLIESLSQTAQDKLLAAQNDAVRNKLIENWVRTAAWSRFRPPDVPHEKLVAFLESLPDKDRAELEQLPRDRLYRELRERYYSSQGTRYGRGPRGGNNRRGNRPEQRSNDGEAGPDTDRRSPERRGPERRGDGRRGEESRENHPRFERPFDGPPPPFHRPPFEGVRPPGPPPVDHASGEAGEAGDELPATRP
jgi:hypothetical protein